MNPTRLAWLGAWVSAGVCCAQPLTLTAPRMKAPQIDGRLTPGEWDGAAASTGFVSLGSQLLAPAQPVFFVAFDDHALYVAVRLPCPLGRAPLCRVTRRDGEVWRDDSVEVFVSPSFPAVAYFQFTVNAAGVVRDGQGTTATWNAAWTSKTSRQANAWTAEVALPWPAFKLTKPPADLAFNVTWNCHTGWPGAYSWAPVTRRFHEPEHFARLALRPAGPAVRLTRLTRSPPGRLTVAAAVVGTATPFRAELTCPNKQTQRYRRALGQDTHVFTLPTSQAFPLPGDYLLTYTCGKAARGRVRFHVPPALALKVEQRMLAGFVDVTADLTGMGKRAQGAKVRLSLTPHAGGDPLPVGTFTVSAAHRLRHTVDMRRAAVGRYTLKATALDARGRLLATASAAVRKPPRPLWLGTPEGRTDRVLPPWTPVRAANHAVRVWGRLYEFGAGVFPTAITTREKSVLAGPIALTAQVNGRRQIWTSRPAQLVERKEDHATFQAHQTTAGLQVGGTTRVDYDGMMRIDLRVTATRPDQPVSLTLEIPVKQEYAKYLYHFPGRWRSAFNAGALPQEGWEGPFKPYVWLGDEWRGLAWFCESEAHWHPADKGRTIQIIRRGDVVRLRLNLLHNVKLAEPLTYTFGFEATPVKPLYPDVWDYRIIHTGNYGLEKRPWSPNLSLTWPAEGNFDVRQGTLEAWVRPRFDPNVPVKPGDPGRGRFNRNFVMFQFGGYTVGYYWNIDDRGMRVYVKAPDGGYPLLLGAANHWKRDEWHHIALSWGNEIRLYDNGKLLAHKPYRGLIGTVPQDLHGGELILGTGGCEMDIDDLAVSDVQREPRGYTGPLTPDAHTLLLEPFDKLAESPTAIRTSPAKADGGPGHGGLSIPLTAGKFGKAISLAPPSAGRTMLDEYQRLGVKTICFHEHWTPVQNSSLVADPEALHRLVRACHAHGIRLLLYFGYEMSNIHPDWDVYHVECLKHPRGGGYHRQPEQRDYIVCYNSPWQDYLAWAIARTMDDYDIDGVYLDGTANPWLCDNEYHGCGYVDENGRRHGTYGIFAARRMMRRIYTIVKSRKPGGQVNVHNSTMMVIPSLGWATSSWDGEQFGGMARGPRFDEVLPLDAFRAEFMGRQWGVPAEFLCYNRPYTQREALAFTLLHDVLVRPYDVEFASKIWRAMETFGRKEAGWLPYWEHSKLVKTNPADVKVSLYLRSAKGLLMVVSNLGRAAHHVTVAVAARRLGLQPDALRMTDALTGESLPHAGPSLHLTLQPMEWRLVHVTPAG